MNTHNRRPERLEIAGFEPFSACDWPGKLSAVVFLQGCPWSCGYCHNFDIIDPKKPGVIAWETVLEHLTNRRGLLDGIVFSGGEPTRQHALISAVREAKNLGFEIGLHTGGAYPNRMKELIEHLDWVGLDIKAPSAKYQAITGVARDNQLPMKTLRMLLDANIPVQVRTTLDPLVLDEEDILEIQQEVTELGVTDFVVQRVRPDGTNPEYAQALAEYRSRCADGKETILPHA
ncbi:anaerobic ribonucleoside-triphosphate reductase activating protein [Timonella sp. A28]|uniref:anaerobic ribonucleoside-triphosphate reductase activating protein n=1 Tax=Timonella sp. A28 TaxID=3442640 RepID=UPI003EC0502B